MIPSRKLRSAIRKCFRNYGAPDRLAQRAERAERLRRIAATTRNGMVPVTYGGRDCDHAYMGPYFRSLPPTVVHFERFCDRWYEGAEGPMWVYIPERYLARAGLL